MSERKIEKMVSCRDQIKKTSGWKSGSGRVKFGDQRKCHELARKGQGWSSLTPVEARATAAVGGTSSDG